MSAALTPVTGADHLAAVDPDVMALAREIAREMILDQVYVAMRAGAPDALLDRLMLAQRNLKVAS